MKVLVIPEDPTHDRYILKPVFERLFAALERPRARIDILENPRLSGVDQALNPAKVAEIVERYSGIVDVFIVAVDRDGNESRRDVAAALERAHGGSLLVCLAIEEVEVWMLALHRESISARWTAIRASHHPKEEFAAALLARAPKWSAGRGRAWAMESLDQKTLGVMLQLCPELDELKRRLAPLLAKS